MKLPLMLTVSLAAALSARVEAQSSSSPKQPSTPPAPANAGAPAAVHIPFIEGKPFAEVLRRARAEKKPVMLDVVAAWCGPCKIMDKTTFSDPLVVEWARKAVIPARVDAEKGEGRRISARYQAFSFPTVLFLDGNGNEIDRLVGGYQAGDFRHGADAVLSGRTPLLEGVAKLRSSWNADEALSVASALALRRDLPRVRPIALRIVSEEGDLSRPEIFQLFAQLVAIETLENDQSSETADLITTFLPRLGSDPRRGFFAAALLTGLGARGDVATARAVAQETLAAVGESTTYSADVVAALGAAERKAGNGAQALAAFERASALTEKNGAAGGPRVERQFDLAEALAAGGRPVEAKKAYLAGTAIGPLDTQLSARAAHVALALKDSVGAVKHARQAVELSNGEDASAQAALAAALRATGDRAGAAAALKRASEIDPRNAEYAAAPEPAKKKPAKAS
ncbi:MAG TPA: thioredoxin family protein [Thermoanaerobaculia bacterium]|nr:thioredoxin family protein [Thermoanaerobaculia bacterium]